jgi:flagellar hook-associated protein 3 FlgL
MRIAGTSFTDSMVSQMNLLAAQQFQLQNQASSGQRIQAPGDDPSAMGQALNLQTASSNAAQYAQNISTLQDRATLTGNALQQLQIISNNVSEIVTTSDGTATSTQMQANASKVTELLKYAVQVLNTKTGGQYLFGGTASGQPPYTLETDASGNVTSVTYQGNNSVSQGEIAENSTLAVDIPGENNSGSGPRGLVSDNRYGADLFNHLISLQNHLLAGDTNSISTMDQPALAKDEDNIIYQVADNGAALTRLDVAASATSTSQSALQTSLTNVAGADLTQTLVQLSQVQNAYQAALKTSSDIMQLRQYLLSYLP